LAHDTDAAGNVIVRKPGQTNAAVVILQGHLDMVNEKNSNVVHDFTKDAIQPQHAGEYLTATGTTLGSDNGIGVAAMLALMESTSVAHGPLEFLFTIDEETGLTGAAEVDATLLTGRRLINLDSEEENTVTVGCAGGASSTLRLPLQTQPTGSAAALTVRLHGLRGGHSGIDIHLQRGNALKLLVRMLHAAHLSSPLRIADLVGGNMHNAIPREASAVVVIDAKVNDVREALQAEFSGVRAEYASADPDMELVVQDAELPGTVWTAETTSTALALLEALPHGVLAMSLDIPGLVETSTNAATARVAEGRLIMLMSNRSSVASALRAVRRRIRAIAQLAGADVEEATGYPGWKPDLSSQLLQVVREVHKQTLGSDPEIKAVHAGLECGIIGEKIVGMDMISFGPQIEFPHSPNERVHIESVARFYRLLIATLERLAR
jgi:dipeptidase D